MDIIPLGGAEIENGKMGQHINGGHIRSPNSDRSFRRYQRRAASLLREGGGDETQRGRNVEAAQDGDLRLYEVQGTVVMQLDLAGAVVRGGGYDDVNENGAQVVQE